MRECETAANLSRMNRVLIATMPAAGHVGPLVPLARELVRRGHVVEELARAATGVPSSRG
jgi:hypothetical protein